MATDLGYALLIGLAAMKLTQLYKEVMRRVGLHNQWSWWKSVASLASCALLVLLVPDMSVRVRVLVALAAAGVAALAHGVDTVLRGSRDSLITSVAVRSRPRSR
jgi:hypothetical protein